MGYYTRFRLEHDCTNSGIIEAIEDTKEKICEGYDPFEDSCKWYEHTEDMKAFSLRFPSVLFTLSGEGEEAGDVWKKYFRNGKVQIALATFSIAEFDERKLV